jgi:hypothetical protein
VKRYCIGIDPGVNTGLAVWDTKDKRFEMIATTTILKAQSEIILFADYVPGYLTQFRLYVENPNLRVWFGKKDREALQGAGSIKRDYSIWQEFAENTGLELIPVAPKNVTQMEGRENAAYFKRLTGYDGTTSKHAREAAMMVFGM